MFSSMIKSFADYTIIVCLMLSYSKLVSVVNQALAQSGVNKYAH